ncbi:MAG: transcriptional repressor NrdR [Candidatus Dadabacteria bacterium]|nr:MAG: transcriptional repressor NrdR [Candidatus Dadabacteria bacterium]
MICPRCGHIDSKVVDSRLSREQTQIRRRRVCSECGFRFTTFEKIEPSLPQIVKRDQRREPFDRDKLRSSIAIACRKRPISQTRIDKAVDRIESRLSEAGDRELPSEQLGLIVMDELREMDQVAYVRFASVYREFQDVEEFMKEIRALVESRKGGAA